MIGRHKTTIKKDNYFVYVKYHNTVIFTLNKAKNIVKLNTDGWNTPTTKRRINQCFDQYGIDAHLYQKDFTWYLINSKGDKIEYFDNVQFKTLNLKKTKGDSMKAYKIIRMYKDDNISNKTIKTGLTLEQAKKHCNDPATSGEGWFDGFTEGI